MTTPASGSRQVLPVTGAAGADLRQTAFIVTLHDVAPRFSEQIARITDQLEPLIGDRLAAAVVPCWHGHPIRRDDHDFRRLVAGRFGEIMLHGFHHQRERGRGLVSLLTRGADEFNGLSVGETRRRLRAGQNVLQTLFGRPASGFIAPTFQRGRVTPELLAECGIDCCIGFRRIDLSNGSRIPVATWCWDMGHSQLLCLGGHVYGNARYGLIPGLVPSLALHPVDVERGFLGRISGLVERLLEEGRRPILPQSLLAVRAAA